MTPKIIALLAMLTLGTAGGATAAVIVATNQTGQAWRYLNPQNAVNPDNGSNNFNSTWFTAGFVDTGWTAVTNPVNFGYGAIDGFSPTNPVTNITAPPSGSPYTAYFRTTFTTVQEFEALTFNLLADDGAIVYLNGAEVHRTSGFGLAADTYFLLTTTQSGNEVFLSPISIAGTLAAGTHTLAVSVHQGGSNTSSDLGLQLSFEGTASAIPEPASFAAIAGLGALGLVGLRRRRR